MAQVKAVKNHLTLKVIWIQTITWNGFNPLRLTLKQEVVWMNRVLW